MYPIIAKSPHIVFQQVICQADPLAYSGYATTPATAPETTGNNNNNNNNK
jgi:hypothetical protein